MEEIKLDRRIDSRFAREVKVKYSLENHNSQYKDCIALNLSIGGVCIQFHRFDALTIGSKVFLEITASQSSTQINVTGEVKWTAQKEYKNICGIKFDEELSYTTLAEFI